MTPRRKVRYKWVPTRRMSNQGPQRIPLVHSKKVLSWSVNGTAVAAGMVGNM
jgi:hypothetical protein